MRILIIGKMNGYISTAAKIAMERGARVSQAENIDVALENLRSGRGADIAIIDVDQNIKSFAKRIKEERIQIDVLACGVNVTPQVAADAIRAGAKEYIPLPPDQELIASILQAVSHVESSMIFESSAMQKWVQLARKIAPSNANVLITGESGTGKEVMARFIHKNSKRFSQNFISVNCAAIPEHLLESELFGHEKGAFTGAIARRIGKFEEANGGTLLLDEISEMHPRLQAKLLRAIQEKVIDRVGGNQPISVDIRIIATSNRDLLKSVEQGDFREDLYFRLNVVNIHLPPLRDRLQDISLLANFFVKKYAALNSMPSKGFSKEALKAMLHYSWRGNVRELENTVHRALLLSQNEEIELEDLFQNYIPTETAESILPAISKDKQILVGNTIAAVERDLILGTLEHCLGNRTHAANILGISIRTLRNKLKEYSEQMEKSSSHSLMG